MRSALADTRVPNVVLYPWQVRMMSQSPGLDIYDMSQLRVIITGGSILGPTISRDLQEKLPTIRFIRSERKNIMENSSLNDQKIRASHLWICVLQSHHITEAINQRMKSKF